MEGSCGNDKFLVMLQKYLLNVSATCSSLYEVIPLSIKFLVS